MKTIQSLLVLVAITLGANTHAAWQTDLRAARAQAQREGKAILVNFTGSDWCGWCIKLKKEVFDKPHFRGYAKDNLVLVEIDFPRKKLQSIKKRKQNEALASKYGVRGYPTILILDANGTEIGKTGYRPGGPGNYVTELEKIIGPQKRKAGPGGGYNTAGGAQPKYDELRLNSISGRKRRLALLNGTTFAEGDVARVRIGEEKVMVRCVQIKKQSVVVSVGKQGEREIKLQ